MVPYMDACMRVTRSPFTSYEQRYVTLSGDAKTHEAKMTGNLPDGNIVVEDDLMVRQQSN
jgi:hypothetical protein